MMKLHCFFLLAAILLPPVARAQFPFLGQQLRNFFQNIIGPISTAPKFKDDGTEAPVATGKDPLFPDDCGRDPDKGTGKLCFPDGLLCQDRK